MKENHLYYPYMENIYVVFRVPLDVQDSSTRVRTRCGNLSPEAVLRVELLSPPEDPGFRRASGL